MPPAGSLHVGLKPYPGYCLARPIGSGGFGEVWEAQAPDGKSTALKFLPCDDNQTAVREIRSLQEIRQLRHPNLIRIERIWCFQGYLVVAMELADGNLLELLEISQEQYRRPLGQEHTIALLSQPAAALDFLNVRQHQINGRRVSVQHCDVKPSNLLVFGDIVKLADFGLSSSLGCQRETHSRAGTLDYCAPEVFQGQLSDHTDQYALAVTYCLLRGGHFPFSDTPKSFKTRYIRPAPDLTMLSEPERPIIGQALHPDPLARWSSCGELMARLARLVKGRKSGRLKRPQRFHA